jgi:hypothetical protein
LSFTFFHLLRDIPDVTEGVADATSSASRLLSLTCTDMRFLACAESQQKEPRKRWGYPKYITKEEWKPFVMNIYQFKLRVGGGGEITSIHFQKQTCLHHHADRLHVERTGNGAAQNGLQPQNRLEIASNAAYMAKKKGVC